MGVFHAVINRVKHLRAIANYEIDVYMISVYDTWLTKHFHHKSIPEEMPTQFEADGIAVNIWWVRHHLRDSASHKLMGSQPARLLKSLENLSEKLKDYSLISAHDLLGAYVARAAHNSYGMPFFVTWHGASIYTDPYVDPMLKPLTCNMLSDATKNFMVSKGLVQKAYELTEGAEFQWKVLRNGANNSFYRYSDDQREALRKELDVEGCKVVTYVGRFHPVKNVEVLPELFSLIKQKYGKPVKFWTIGNGPLLKKVSADMVKADIDCKMWDFQETEQMPRFMNCTDVLVLPSRLEGLPLVTIEAIACGANAVATDVVGTAESIGKENAIALDEHLVENMATRIVEMLNQHIEQLLPEKCTWEATAERENNIYQQYLNTHTQHA